MLEWIKKTRLYALLAFLVLGALKLWGMKKKNDGVRQANQANQEAQRQREDATRERGRQADEKIRSGGDNFISDWLRDNNRFRD